MSGRISPVNQTPSHETKLGVHRTDVGRLSPFQVENLTPKKLDLGGLSSDFASLRRVDPGLGLELKRSVLQLVNRFVRDIKAEAVILNGENAGRVFTGIRLSRTVHCKCLAHSQTLCELCAGIGTATTCARVCFKCCR